MCLFLCVFFFFKQKTAYEMRISDWSSDVCSSDLGPICPSPNKATNRVMTAHNRIAPITHRPIAQGLRCASIAHPRLEIDLVDLQPPAVTACLHHDVDEHAEESANIVQREIEHAFRYPAEHTQISQRAGGVHTRGGA